MHTQPIEFLTEKQKRNFWKRVDKDGPEITPELGKCWPWRGNATPYGRQRIRHFQYAAHRISWFLHYGEPTLEKPWILHRCDNPPCVNPAHLFDGTNQDNVDDMVRKGRNKWAIAGVDYPFSCLYTETKWDEVKFGSECEQAKLNEDQVRDIRYRFSNGESKKSLARRYGVVPTTIRSIIWGKSWRHILPGNEDLFRVENP